MHNAGGLPVALQLGAHLQPRLAHSRPGPNLIFVYLTKKEEEEEEEKVAHSFPSSGSKEQFFKKKRHRTWTANPPSVFYNTLQAKLFVHCFEHSWTTWTAQNAQPDPRHRGRAATWSLRPANSPPPIRLLSPEPFVPASNGLGPGMGGMLMAWLGAAGYAEDDVCKSKGGACLSRSTNICVSTCCVVGKSKMQTSKTTRRRRRRRRRRRGNAK